MPVEVLSMAVAAETVLAVGLLLPLLGRSWRLRAAWGPVRCDGTRAGSSSFLAELPAPVVAWDLLQRRSGVWFERCPECVLLKIWTG